MLLTITYLLQLTIDAQIGKGVRGDIAIDDITFTTGRCTGVIPTASTLPPVTVPTPTYRESHKISCFRCCKVSNKKA